MPTNKSLGQHWLKDRYILAEIADLADIEAEDSVLEIGPGLGTLTSELLRRAKKVIAVEFDSELASKLPGQFPGKNLEVENQDILSYNLDSLPPGYKVAANVPYYITSKIVQKFRSMRFYRPNAARRCKSNDGRSACLFVVSFTFDLDVLTVDVNFSDCFHVVGSSLQLEKRQRFRHVVFGIVYSLTNLRLAPSFLQVLKLHFWFYLLAVGPTVYVATYGHQCKPLRNRATHTCLTVCRMRWPLIASLVTNGHVSVALQSRTQKAC